MCWALNELDIDPSRIFNFDDMGVHVGEEFNTRPKVLTNKEMNALLRAGNIAPAVTENVEKGMTIKITDIISWEGLEGIIWIIHHDSFDDLDNDIYMLDLGNSQWAILHRPNINETLLVAHVISKIISPLAEKQRQRLLDMHTKDLVPEEVPGDIVEDLAEYFGKKVHLGGLNPTGMGADNRGTSKLPPSRSSDIMTLEAAEEADNTENGLAIAHALKPRAAKRAKGSSTSSDGKQSKNTHAARPRTPAPETKEDSEGELDEETEKGEEQGSPMEVATPMPVQAVANERPSSLRKKILAIKEARLASPAPQPAGASSSSSSSSGVPHPAVGSGGATPDPSKGCYATYEQ